MTNARLIHTGNTRAGRKLFFRLEKERAKLQAAGFEPSTKLLAAALDVHEKDVEEVEAHLASREVGLDSAPDQEGLRLEERISLPEQASPETEAGRHMLADAIRTLMETFADSLDDPREAAVWTEHLAAQEEPASLGDLGKRFGVSKQRMGQIADRLKKRFKEVLIQELGEDIQMMWQPNVEE
jgi:RNA polymerase sigma-32 factor